MEIVSGKIVAVDAHSLMVRVPYNDIHRYIHRQYEDVSVALQDGRTITPKQRRKAHALINEIAEWTGDLPEYVKRLMKIEFIFNRLETLERKMFSLSNCDETTAREFITYLIDFMIEHEVPSRVPLAEQCEDVQRYMYSCVMHKRCAVCGRKSDLHHVDRVGMGRNRNTIIHEGMLVEPLCREHHMECHTMAQDEFDGTYHIAPIKATKDVCKYYGLKYIAE